ncbi:MAG: flippase-like domain-containing protein [Anaerolineaceae bacterium]|nr:flippase-like domain-containing protein [Anaerolineaceae bacterium]
MKISSNFMMRRLLPGLVLGFVVLVGLALLGDLREVSRSLLRFRWEYFLIAIGFTLLNYALRFIKWHFYIQQVGVHNLDWKQSLRLFVAGFPLAVTPGKVGEALKGVWLNRTSNIPVGRGVAVVLAERISDGLAVMILSIFGVIAYPQYWAAFIVILVILLLIIVISQIRPVALFLITLGEKIPLVSRLAHQIREFYEGSFALFRPGAVLLAVLLGTISWLGEGIGLYFILVGLGLQPSFELMATAVFVLAFSTAIGAASAMPGGLGAAEGTIAVMLPLTLGVSPAIAASATLLIRLATLWFGVGIGMITWIFSMDLLGLHQEREINVET